MKRFKKTLLLIVSAFFLFQAAAAHAQVPGQLFASTGGSGPALLATIDPATGAATPVAPAGTLGPVTELQFAADNTLFGGTGAGISLLITIDPVTGLEAPVAPHPPGVMNGMEFDDAGVLWATVFDFTGSGLAHLTIVDPVNAQFLFQFPPTSFRAITGLAFSPSGVLYGIGRTGGPTESLTDELITIDTSTGVATHVGFIGADFVSGLAFGPTGTLYAGTGSQSIFPGPGVLMTIDPATGIGTPVGPSGLPAISGLSFYPSVTPASVTVTSPNGGESWGAGTNRQITWTSSGVTGNVALEYSPGASDAGVTWISIDASTPNDGSYLWSVPNNPTSGALVRVSAANDPGIQDVSDGAFTITGSALAVTRPNGAESFSIGAKENVNWNPGGLSGTVRLEYSTDNGANWSVIQASVANDGNFKWTVPATASAQSLVRVTSNLVPSITDVSDAVFTIGASAFALTNPTGGENWTVGSAQYIQWNPDGLGGTVALWYSTDGGAGWTSIDAATLNDGSFKWFIPNQVTAQAQVRIETNLTPSNADTSGDFTISAPGLLLIRPNGGESFVVGTKESIFWNTGGLSGTVRLEYSTDGGGSFSIIKASVANDGNFRWLVPNDVTAQARVRVRSNSAPSIADTSDNDFAISLTLPKGGEFANLIPVEFGIYQNFPNPFNPSTQIRYDLPEASEVTLKVYNMLGKEVSTLAQGMKPAGIHFSTFDATGLSSGIYIYRIQAKGLSQKIYTQILKMAYVK